MKKHFIGATYDLTQENFQHVIKQLDEANEIIFLLEKALENIEFCPRSLSEYIISDMQRTAREAIAELKKYREGK